MGLELWPLLHLSEVSNWIPLDLSWFRTLSEATKDLEFITDWLVFQLNSIQMFRWPCTNNLLEVSSDGAADLAQGRGLKLAIRFTTSSLKTENQPPELLPPSTATFLYYLSFTVGILQTWFAGYSANMRVVINCFYSPFCPKSASP